MANYTPDKWVVIKITHTEGTVYKVFASWYGGYTGGDSWKLNSGITRVEEENDCYVFAGSSGSTYTCRKEHYGTNLYGHSVLSNIIENAVGSGVTVEILDSTTQFLELTYE